MIDSPAFDMPPALIAPAETARPADTARPAEIARPVEIARKGGRRSRRAALTIGALIILDDGSECVVAGFDKDGNVLCLPSE